ncbi:MAG: tetratricopeptide repeat protein, partial [Anaerolineae bacterium]
MQKALAHREKGELSAAAIEYKNVLKKEPDNAEARWMLGKTYLDMNNGVGARKELERARSLGQQGPELEIALARSMLMTGDAEGALKLLDAATDIEQDADTLALRGDVELALKRTDAAAKHYRASLAADGNFIQARYGLIRLAMMAQDYDEAGRQIETVLQQQPNDFQALVFKAELTLDRGDAEQAVALYNQALKQSDSVFARLGLARAYLLLDKSAEAETQLDTILQKDPENLAGRYLKAVAARQRNDLAGAKTLLLEVLSKAPDHYPSLLMLGSVQSALGEYEQAVK